MTTKNKTNNKKASSTSRKQNARKLTRTSEVKLSLAEKQLLKLEAQKKKVAEKAAKGEAEPKNKDRFYCTNKELHQELLKWRNSCACGLTVFKKKDGKLVKTEIEDTPEQHEQYQEGTLYFVMLSTVPDTEEVVVWNKTTQQEEKLIIPGPNSLLLEKAKKLLSELKKTTRKDKSYYDDFCEIHRGYVLHDITEIVKREGWAFNYDIVERRILTDKLGNMMIAIGDKLLNHSSFRSYDQELKLDMRSLFFVKLLKGLKNYNFKFSNPFSFFTTCAWNSFLIVLNLHYKHQNIRFEIMLKMAAELQAYTGISPNTGLSRCIKIYLGNDVNGNGD